MKKEKTRVWAKSQVNENEIFITAVEKVLREKLVCLVMRKGKKELARKIVEKVIDEAKSPTVLAAIARSAPGQVTKGMRKGAQRVKVPFPLKAESRAFMGLRFIVEEAKKNVRGGGGITEELIKEVRKAASNQGGAVQRKRKVSSEGAAGNIYMRWG